MVYLIFTSVIVTQFFLVPVVKGAPSEPRNNDSETVFGGSEAKEGDFPYQVFLSSGSSMCGGSIYDANTIITAAHCVFDSNKQRVPLRDIKVFAGSTEPDRGQLRLARYVTPHEDYNPNRYSYDIAIIGLSQPLIFGRNVQAIPLTPSETTFQPGTTCVLSGFGSTTNRDGDTENLRYATMNIKPDSNCARRYAGDRWNPESMVCAGGDGTNQCSGDSGGPLACPIQGTLHHYGVVSMGPNECGTRGFPGTYSKISHYNTWVRRNIRMNMNPIDSMLELRLLN